MKYKTCCFLSESDNKPIYEEWEFLDEAVQACEISAKADLYDGFELHSTWENGICTNLFVKI